MQVAQRPEKEIGEKYQCGQQNGREISSEKLRHGGPCDVIIVNLFATRDKRYRTIICGSGESSVGNLFSLSFL